MELYRYESSRDSYGCVPVIHLRKFTIIRETEMCYVIKHPRALMVFKKDKFVYKEKFILKSKGRKRYAWANKEEALNSFRIRNARRIEYLEADLRFANKVKDMLKNYRIDAK